ncbi:tail fiber protein [Mucilaginibacter sp. ZT4R22]|uniref:Tail fiber protein n=1 Tax=Mucilaginibacter pankratovii TaxID=2772110 RepID=A0ABR7WJ11_9SPHI|nr:phage tail protein [Mucilaginibacter pankratovii]MBD1362322.1 tail fiber protein [Mucilaginibacter pankratovii]
MMEETLKATTASVTATINLLPVGTIIPYGGPQSAVSNLENQGWLPCTGGKVSKQKYKELYDLITQSCGIAGADEFYLPDLRGQFLRGVSQADDIDSKTRIAQNAGGNDGPLVFSRQGDEIKEHRHSVHMMTTKENIHFPRTNDHFSAPTNWENKDSDNFGGKETRPRNVYVHYIIFAGLPKT